MRGPGWRKSRESPHGMGLRGKEAWEVIREAGKNSGSIRGTEIKESGDRTPRRRQWPVAPTVWTDSKQ